MLTTLLLVVATTLPQDADDPSASEDVRSWPWGAVESPIQPTGRSTADVIKTPRFTPKTNRPILDSLRIPVKSLVAVRGQEENHVMGVGLVTGLAGTGDTSDTAKQLVKNLLLTRGIHIDIQDLNAKNVAIVRVEAKLPAGIKPGRNLSVRVSAMGDAKSLEGGTLSFTELTDVTGEHVYVTAAGSLTVGGFRAEGNGATAIRNHVTVATIPAGGKVEREVPTSIVSDHGYIYLDARMGQDTFGNTVRITEAINGLYPGAAIALLDGKTIRVAVPGDLPEELYLAYLSSLLDQEVQSENVARVLVDESSGLIVMGGDVRLRPGLVVHGNLTVTITETPQISQPGPFSNGTTEVVDRTDLQITEENNGPVLMPGAANLKEVADVLNLLGTTPRDTISILQGMQRNGLLVAEIQRL